MSQKIYTFRTNHSFHAILFILALAAIACALLPE